MEPTAKEEQQGSTDAKTLIGFLVGSGLLGLLAVGMATVANNAQIAINVAEQHGQELLLLRGELVALRLEMVERTQDRFTASDGRYLKEELRRIEEDIEEHIKGHKK